MKKYIRKIKKYIKQYPAQAAMYGYNIGIFAWLQTVLGTAKMDFSTLKESEFGSLVFQHAESAKKLLVSLPYGWLIISVVATIALRNIKKTAKKMIIFVIILFGLVFVYSYARLSGWISW